MFERPGIYTSISDRGDFSNFDREYEREHMPELIRAGWPINWEYVNTQNIGPVMLSLLHRTLSFSQNNGILRQEANIESAKVSEGITQKVMSLLQIKKQEETGNEGNIDDDPKRIVHV